MPPAIPLGDVDINQGPPITKKSKKIELKDIQNKNIKFAAKLPRIPISAINKTSLRLAFKLLNCSARETLRINF